MLAAGVGGGLAAALAAGTHAVVMTAATSRVSVLPESVRNRVDASLEASGGG